MRCSECGKLFRWTGHGRQPSYCSDTCRRRSNRKKKRLEKLHATQKQAEKIAEETVNVSRSGKVEKIPEKVAASVRSEITNRDFEKMMGHGYADDLEFVTRILRKAMTEASTPASALAPLAKTLLEVSKRLDELDSKANATGLDALLKGDDTHDILFTPDA